MDAVFSISLPRQAYTVSVVRDVLSTLLRRAGLCRDCADDVVLATSEACANAIEHAGSGHDYRVEADLDADLCELRISHNGGAPGDAAPPRGFLRDHVPLPRLSAESGRGIFLMRCLMDEVAFRTAPRSTVLLRKHLAACDRHGGPGGAPAPRHDFAAL
ncbi:serine/threonine protein kinase [Nocardiopsis sp. CNR-923]|uniref:ATP-binding protein n=1 Tax=Nocardiopsis sp. CNR-923 TaxID=1904965 RepID=UPI00095BB475|nr:ATP-binding protein [Nocardiopsis sp. CNR-923]OLT28631.1 serine/threonine protein kinase [Nocardiopsis sp. CNR-923]